MSKSRLAENIMRWRRKKGLSQEKTAEYVGVSRQAVTKWEAGISRPSSDNLIKLAQLLEVSVDMLLGDEEEEKALKKEETAIGKTPWIFMGISVLCILAYVIYGAWANAFSVGTFICMFILCVPIQLFLHIYLSNAIKNDAFHGIAGFDDRIEYNVYEVKKLLIQIDMHIGILSAVYIFSLCVISGMGLKMQWLNGILIVLYVLDFIMGIEISNYKMTDRIYCREEDKKRAKRSIPITVIYTLLVCVGIGITTLIFEVKGIENNTLPAIKICGLLLLGIMSITISFFLENRKIKKWNPAEGGCKTAKISIISWILCVALYGFICIV